MLIPTTLLIKMCAEKLRKDLELASGSVLVRSFDLNPPQLFEFPIETDKKLGRIDLAKFSRALYGAANRISFENFVKIWALCVRTINDEPPGRAESTAREAFHSVTPNAPTPPAPGHLAYMVVVLRCIALSLKIKLVFTEDSVLAHHGRELIELNPRMSYWTDSCAPFKGLTAKDLEPPIRNPLPLPQQTTSALYNYLMLYMPHQKEVIDLVFSAAVQLGPASESELTDVFELFKPSADQDIYSWARNIIESSTTNPGFVLQDGLKQHLQPAQFIALFGHVSTNKTYTDAQRKKHWAAVQRWQEEGAPFMVQPVEKKPPATHELLKLQELLR